MKQIKLATVATALALCSPSALSQVFVIGGGFGAQCYEATKDPSSSFRTAEELCTKALSEDAMTRGNRAATLVNLGILRMRNGDYDDSIADYDRAIQISDRLGEAYLNKGAALIYQRNYEAATLALNKAIEYQSSQLFAAYYNRAIALENSGDISAAFFDFKKALELNPGWELAEMQLRRFKVDSVNG